MGIAQFYMGFSLKSTGDQEDTNWRIKVADVPNHLPLSFKCCWGYVGKFKVEFHELHTPAHVASVYEGQNSSLKY